jgi:leader peptidase (prepilin peptidase) / N-methyltransferase
MSYEQQILVTVFGLLIGSFLNVLIYRIPAGQSVSFPASHCPACHTPLKPWHNIPLFSWLFLRGKCGFCKVDISFQYPLIELLTSLIFLTIFTIQGWNLISLFTSFVFVLLLALSIIDWRYKAVPDSLNLLALLCAILVDPLFAFKDALLFAGGFTLLRFVMSYYLFKKFTALESLRKPASWRKNYNIYPHFEAMGEADIIVAATIGALLGIHVGLFAIFLSALLTLPVALLRSDKQTPYVPFLAIALFISYLFHAELSAWLATIYV